MAVLSPSQRKRRGNNAANHLRIEWEDRSFGGNNGKGGVVKGLLLPLALGRWYTEGGRGREFELTRKKGERDE